MTQITTSQERLYTVREVADRFRLSEACIWNWVWARKLTYVRIGRKAVRIPESAITELISAGTVNREMEQECGIDSMCDQTLAREIARA